MARRLKATSVYEVRGFWLLTEGVECGRPVDVDAAVAADAAVCKTAGHVVAICRGIADVLVRNGVPSSATSIVPNGVDACAFAPVPYDKELARQLGLEGRFVYGYATNVRRLEGVQDVIRAWPLIKRAVPEAAFLLIGDGNYRDSLRQLAREQGVEGDWKMVGRVPHSQMKAYYSLLDVFVVPRVREPVCEIVTPLKPLEAMAMGIPVVASDVSALREMVEDGKTGLLFEAGDSESLASTCARIAADSLLMADLRRSARDWVLTERDWRVLASRYTSVYESVLS
jgi:glycosyltransferase involved in cell wall biosynthesis